jgi:putative oxidoreductase
MLRATSLKRDGAFMKLASTIARYLAGIMFTVFGLNGFLHFIPQPPAPELAIQWMTPMLQSHFILVPFAFQLVAGVLLLSGRYVPLALAILAPILVNILAFHATMAPASVAPALIATACWVLIFLRYRESFRGIFEIEPKPLPQ